LPNASLKDDDDVQITYSTNEIAVLYRKQAQMHLCLVLTCSKKHYSVPISSVCQGKWLWSKHTQTSLKWLGIAYNNAY